MQDIDSWKSTLWKSAEEKWRSRTGQDHLYRDAVVTPAILPLFNKKFESLVDLGGSDNEARKRMLDCVKRQYVPRRIISTDLHVSDEQTVKIDLEKTLFDQQLSDLPQPRLILAIFVVQELRNLDNLCLSLKKSMGTDDVFAFIIPHPDFAHWLMEQGKMKMVKKGGLEEDWEWAGEYPVPVNEKEVIYLPNFQRSAKDIKEKFSEYGFELSTPTPKALTLPENKVTKEIFLKTIYGEHILKHASGLLFEFKLKLT